MDAAIKVLVVGDGSVGKSSWVSVLLKDSFPCEYKPTEGVEVHSYTSCYLDSVLRYSLWDCSGHPDHLGLFDGYYIGAQAAIIFYDCMSYHTRSTVSIYKRNIKSALWNIPIFVVRNKIDLLEDLPDTCEQTISLSAKKKLNVFEPIQKLDEYFASVKVARDREDGNEI